MRHVLVTLAALVAGIALVFASATVVSAHSELEESSPAQGATVSSVTELVLTFGEEIVPDYSTVVLADSSGSGVALGDPSYNSTFTTVTLPITGGALPNDDYVAGYRIVSIDGHPISGEVGFTVEGSSASALVAPTSTAPAEPLTNASSDGSDGTTEIVTLTAQEDGPNVLVLVGTIFATLVALGLVTVVLLVAIRRNRAKPTN